MAIVELGIHNFFANSETDGSTSIPSQPQQESFPVPLETETFPVKANVLFNTDTDFVNFQLGEFDV